MELPTFSRLWELAKSIPDAAVGSYDAIVHDEVGPDYGELYKKAEAEAKKAAQPKRDAKVPLDHRSNQAKGRLVTIDVNDSLRVENKAGTQKQREQWKKEAEEAQKLTKDLSDAEAEYRHSLDGFESSVRQSLAAKKYLTGLIGTSNLQTNRVYFRTGLELSAVVAVSAILDLFTKGTVSLVVGQVGDAAKDAIKAQRGPAAKKAEDARQRAAENEKGAFQTGLDTAGKNLLDGIDKASKLPESGLVGKIVSTAASKLGASPELITKGGEALKNAAANPYFKNGLTIVKAPLDIAAVQEAYDLPVPSLSLNSYSDAGLKDLAAQVDQLGPGSELAVSKDRFKSAIEDVRKGQEDVVKSGNRLIQAAAKYADAIEKAEKFKVSWSKPKR